MINVEVAYAPAAHQHELVKLILPDGASVQDALEASGLLERYPELDPKADNKLGIFGKLTKPDAVLRDRDRVEIYRPLIADPKAVRKRRAAEGKAMKKGAGALDSEGETTSVKGGEKDGEKGSEKSSEERREGEGRLA